MAKGVYPRTEWHKEVNSLCHLGKRHTEEWKKNISKSMPKGANVYNWKGMDVSYRALHSWVSRWMGKPSKCSECGKVGYGRKMHWANKSGEYKRDLTDWVRLCAKCHLHYDKENGLRVFKHQHA